MFGKNLISVPKIFNTTLVTTFLFWLLTIISINIHLSPADPFYYLKSLPIFYWVGLFLIIISISILFLNPTMRKCYVHNYVLILLIGLYLFGIAPFAYPNPTHMDIYGYLDNVNQLIDHGFIKVSGSYIEAYPLATIFYADFIKIIGINPMTFSRLYPIISIFIAATLIYATSYISIGQWSFLPPIIYLSNSWIPIHYMVPQSFGFLITLLMILIFVSMYLRVAHAKKPFAHKALFIFVLFALVLSHPVTPMINMLAFSVMFLFFVYVLRSNTKNPMHNVYSHSLLNILILFFIIYFSYLLFKSNFILDAAITLIKQSILSLQEQKTLLVDVDWTSTSPMLEYTIATKLRMMNLFIMFILGTFMTSLILFRWRCEKIICAIFTGLFCGYGVIIVLNILTRQTTFIDRGFIFVLIPFCILMALALNFIECANTAGAYKSFLFLIVIFNLIIFPVLGGSSFQYQYYSESEMAGKQFIESHEELERMIKFQFHGSKFVYNNFWYNYISIHHQKGEEYRAQFNTIGLFKTYDSGSSKIYYPNNINLVKLDYWKLTGYRE